jgi:hypothetical protein
MTRLNVDILNPKAEKLLKDLADLDLININPISEINDLSGAVVNEPVLDYTKYQIPVKDLKFDRDEINER